MSSARVLKSNRPLAHEDPSRRDSATTLCLRRQRQAPTTCTSEWESEGCLASKVPAWKVTYDEATACFRCCLLRATTPLESNRAFWSTKLSQHYMGTKHGIDPSESVLLGHNSDLRFADIGGLHGNPTLEEPAVLGTGNRSVLVSLQGGAGWVRKEQHEALWRRLDGSRRVTLLSVGDEDLPRREMLGRLNSQALITWFVNSPTNTTHPKLQPYPRGLQQTYRWAIALRGEKRQMQRPHGRPTLLMCGCLSETHSERILKLQILQANGFACQPDCERYVGELLNATFVASPRGNGPQNHRDFEALIAGAIPLVDYHPRLAPMWEGLPVIQVRNWLEITPSYLRGMWAKMHTQEFDLAKAYFPYWLHRLTAGRPWPTQLPPPGVHVTDPSGLSLSAGHGQGHVKSNRSGSAGRHRKRDRTASSSIQSA